MDSPAIAAIAQSRLAADSHVDHDTIAARPTPSPRRPSSRTSSRSATRRRSPSPPHTVTEITGGNLNYAWAVRDGSGGGVFVKQAPPYIKCLGADYGLPAERMLLESAALDLYGRVAPGTVPRHLHLDPQRCVMVLELLDGYELMRTALRAGRTDAKHAAEEVGKFMGLTHKATHRDRVPAAERAALEAHFANATMCEDHGRLRLHEATRRRRPDQQVLGRRRRSGGGRCAPTTSCAVGSPSCARSSCPRRSA